MEWKGCSMTTIWKDGEFIDSFTPSMMADDCAFAGGLGVFDSMMAKDSVLIDAGDHFDRLIHDVEIVLGMGASWLPGFLTMTEVWQPLLSLNNLSKGYARIRTMVTGGISSGPLSISGVPTVVVSVAPAGSPDNLPPIQCAVISDFPRIANCVLENCKRLDYTRSFAARRKARELGAEEAIITNTEGNIACAATSNIYIRENGVLITPPLRDGVLAGITRKKMLECGEAIEQSISIDRLKTAEDVFISNSFTGLRKVTIQP
jgi:branched-chain amino acid aminotransferase